MIDPQGIKRKAQRLYPEVLQAALEEAEPELWHAPRKERSSVSNGQRPLFPLDLRVDRGRSTDPFTVRRKGIETLHAFSKNRTGTGYSLVLREVATRREGRQSLVDAIRFETREDFLAFLGKRAELDGFVLAARAVAKMLPLLACWIHEEPLTFLSYLGEWTDLAAVCDYFIRHPRPGCYARQLPVAVHTKFIEEHHGILRKLLDRLLPDTAVDTSATSFEDRYGLRSPESLVRIRFLDPSLAHSSLEDLTLPVSSHAQLPVVCRTAFIVENLMTFLSFPAVEGAVCVWGSGFKAIILGSTPWLRNCQALYWGDLDRSGFEILASLRLALPHVESMLMDLPTYRRYQAYAVTDLGAGDTTRLATARDGILNDSERSAVAALAEDPRRSRLEQERITHADLISYLKGAGFRVLDSQGNVQSGSAKGGVKG